MLGIVRKHISHTIQFGRFVQWFALESEDANVKLGWRTSRKAAAEMLLAREKACPGCAGVCGKDPFHCIFSDLEQ